MKSPLVAIGLGLGLVGLAACAGSTHQGESPSSSQAALIGKTKDDLFACAGHPVSEKATPNQTVVVYYREASQLEESFPGSKGSFAMVHHGCRATIIFRDDRIDTVRYESLPRSYRDEDHCEDIFAGCVGIGSAQGTP